MKNYLIISTGGTISCTNSVKGLLPTISAEQILRLCNTDSSEYDITVLSQTDSTDIDTDLLNKLVQLTGSSVDKYKGILILHGTDTLEATASLLSAYFDHCDIPVAITGSMLPAESQNSDAPINVRTAVSLLKSGLNGVYVVIGGKVIKGSKAVKVFTDRVCAFYSADETYISLASPQKCEHTPLTQQGFVPDFKKGLEPRIFLLRFSPVMGLDIFDYIEQMDYRGCIISGYGAGGVPIRFYDKIKTLSEKGIIFAMTSQCAFGKVDFSLYATGSLAFKLGIIPLPQMSDMAAVMRLSAALGSTYNYNDIYSFMTKL